MPVTTIAGSSGIGAADGVGIMATFSTVFGIAIANTTVSPFALVADFNNHRIRWVNMRTMQVLTLAGSGIAGSVDGPGTAAQVQYE